MAFATVWPRLSAAEFFNDVERRAGPVSPSSQGQGPRPSDPASRRFRPRLPGRAPQQRPADRGPVGGQRPAANALRLRDLEAGGQSSRAQQSAAPAARGATVFAGARRPGRRAYGATRGSAGNVSGAEGGAHDLNATRTPPEPVSGVALLDDAWFDKLTTNGIGNLDAERAAAEPVSGVAAVTNAWFDKLTTNGLRKLGWKGETLIAVCVCIHSD